MEGSTMRPKKRYLFTCDTKRFYEDMTYRCPGWPKDDYTNIKFTENDIAFMHKGYEGWDYFSDSIDEKLIRKIKKKYREHADKIFEEMVLEVNKDD